MEATEAEKINATTMKRWFKSKYGIAVRVQTTKHYVRAWNVPIPNADVHAPLKWAKLFPPELGNACMRLVYRNSDKLREQSWGGNITPNSIAMHRAEWAQLLSQD